ncbi:hypothetical protein COCCADRAFT_41933 [Bipolaris zeicola 26-R-13]|uniref:NACHT domain-containing protein n=1 Tax=Cochliobolus carbonum (strain 26-R-13) TaxID=930089 RepID=W6Y891_COCC2|nr:uncharacterized protein COCCADRAFT_41933 [Bipolaris zeicola 26-R-13]EUC27301.1 hypothetical protein COCCADRAFT_41933 [Bipolaris zeicola 26-R-13]
MRLLRYSERGELSIHSFDDGDIPPYAILSHTWGADDDEVTFADLQAGGGKTKLGYKKIVFCGEQAQQDNLQYFWIDTCCIDKVNKAELAFSIRSMFRWYRNATRCYAYLSDVWKRKRKACDRASELSWEPAFKLSQWFTRGWTFQELLAPTIVEFFSQEGESLGSKTSLQTMIHEITNIPSEVLNGTPLSRFSVNERLRWAEGRTTRRVEDRAYCLQGILNVELAPVYGEGEAGAFKRLTGEVDKLERCIQDIRQTDPCDDKKRIEDTKGGLLADSYRWILDNTTFKQWYDDQHSRLLWVKGDPGKGKTMLLCGIIDELQNSLPQTALLSYFFCQATDSRINSATAVLRGLLYMLVDQQPLLAVHVRKKHDRAGRNLFNDANAWVALTEIFPAVLQDVSLGTTYLIIDALDECVTDLSKLLRFIEKQSSTFSRLAQEKRYTPVVQYAVLQHLTSNANDTFLWVALVCQDLKVTPKWNVLKKLAQFPPGLDSLYSRMLQQISESGSADMCMRVLAVTAVLYRPVTVAELVVLTEQLIDFVDDLDSVHEIIGLCGSFLTLRDDIVYFVHQSAKDFLTKASNEVFPDGIEHVHQTIFAKSLTILHKELYRDMYNLQAPECFIGDVRPPHNNPLAVSRYPCVYWIDHFCDSKYKTPAYSATICTFLEQQYLYWLEALSLCKSMAKGVVSMTKLWHAVQELGDTYALNDIVYDARRFIMYHKETIENYRLQAYASALLFSPADSIVRRLFQHEALRGVTVKPAISNGWSVCLQTLGDHGSAVASVAFSHDSTRLASALGDTTIKIWDANSWTCMHTLEGHNGVVYSVAFSHDSTRLASASSDRTVKIWDMRSRTCVETLESHDGDVLSVAFSHDSTQLASAFDIGIPLSHMSFDSTGTLLHTEVGTITTSSSQITDRIGVAASKLQYQGAGISLDRNWVVCNGRSVLWIPFEYRPSSLAVSETQVGMGVGSGRVWLCQVV